MPGGRSFGRPRWRDLAMAAMLARATDCGEPLSPFKPDVSDTTDSFQFEVAGLRDLSGTAQYHWENSRAAAEVDQTASLTAGTGELIIRDAGGTVVYRRTLGDRGVFRTAIGAAGTWIVRADFDGASGAASFRLQAR